MCVRVRVRVCARVCLYMERKVGVSEEGRGAVAEKVKDHLFRGIWGSEGATLPAHF